MCPNRQEKKAPGNEEMLQAGEPVALCLDTPIFGEDMHKSGQFGASLWACSERVQCQRPCFLLKGWC